MYRVTVAALAALLSVLLSGAPTSAAERLKVVASFSILGDIVSNVGGERVAVTTLVGPDGDAHVYEPTPSDAAALAGADLVVVNGLGFEGWLDRLIAASGYDGAVIVASQGIAARDMPEDEAHHQEAAEAGAAQAANHGHGVDPHAWQSLANGEIYVSNTLAALANADPDGAGAYAANAEAYLNALRETEAWVKSELAKVPESERRVITSHDAFGYFAAAYGFEFLAPVGLSTEDEPTASEVASLIEQIRRDQVRALFVENISDPRIIEQIARETGAVLGGTLYSDALSPPGEPGDTYLKMFRHNVGQIAKALIGA